MHRLAVHPQRLAAGHQDPRLRAGVEDRVGQVGGGVEEVLAVVQHQQHLPGSQVGRQHSGSHGALTLDAGRLGDRARDVGLVTRGGELGEDDVRARLPVRLPVGPEQARDGQREGRLAAPPGPEIVTTR